MSGQENSLLIKALGELTQAISRQTQAMAALVESNTQILECLMDQDDEGDPDAPTERYLDGSPCR